MKMAIKFSKNCHKYLKKLIIAVFCSISVEVYGAVRSALRQSEQLVNEKVSHKQNGWESHEQHSRSEVIQAGTVALSTDLWVFTTRSVHDSRVIFKFSHYKPTLTAAPRGVI